ncbi:MAG: hypothetical protein ACOH10_07930 [Rhodoglobus sp.]
MTRLALIPIALIPIALLALAGCTAAPAPPPSTSAPAATTPTPKPTMTATADPIAAVVAKIGCLGWVQSPTPAPSADMWGTCTIAGSKVQVYKVTGDAGYAAFLATMKPYGVTEAWLARSGDVIVAPSDQTQMPAIRAALS